MNRTPVESTNIADIGYDPTTQTLEIGFLNGTVYQYLNVPPNIFSQLMSASSHGTFLNKQIKPKYQYKQIQ